MRLSFDRLAMLAETVLFESPYSGHLFVYFNKRRDRVKVLLWDSSGLAIYYKRLEEGTYRLPESDTARIEMTYTDLMLIMEGIDLKGVHRRKWYKKRIKKI
jgi:transposase